MIFALVTYLLAGAVVVAWIAGRNDDLVVEGPIDAFVVAFVAATWPIWVVVEAKGQL